MPADTSCSDMLDYTGLRPWDERPSTRLSTSSSTSETMSSSVMESVRAVLDRHHPCCANGRSGCVSGQRHVRVTNPQPRMSPTTSPVIQGGQTPAPMSPPQPVHGPPVASPLEESTESCEGLSSGGSSMGSCSSTPNSLASSLDNPTSPRYRVRRGSRMLEPPRFPSNMGELHLEGDAILCFTKDHKELQGHIAVTRSNLPEEQYGLAGYATLVDEPIREAAEECKCPPELPPSPGACYCATDMAYSLTLVDYDDLDQVEKPVRLDNVLKRQVGNGWTLTCGDELEFDSTDVLVGSKADLVIRKFFNFKLLDIGCFVLKGKIRLSVSDPQNEVPPISNPGIL